MSCNCGSDPHGGGRQNRPITPYHDAAVYTLHPITANVMALQLNNTIYLHN